MDKGIINKRQGSVTFTVTIDGESRDIVIVPGHNRLSEKQFDALQTNKFFRNYTQTTIRDVPETTQNAEGTLVTRIVKVREPGIFEILDIPAAGEGSGEGGEEAAPAANRQRSGGGAGGGKKPKAGTDGSGEGTGEGSGEGA